MLEKKFNISNQINIKQVEKIYDKNFEEIILEFAKLEVDWLHNAYNEYKDIDKYLILINLINKTLSTYNKHFYKISFDTFYNNPHIEIESFSIIDLVNELKISKETVRRKLNELSKYGVIIRKKKKIQITRVASNPNLEKNVHNLAKLINIFSRNFEKQNELSKFSIKEIEKKIFSNYTQYWNLFFNFQIPYVLRWKKICDSSENFYIFALCALNEIFNSKKIGKKNKVRTFINVEQLHDNIPIIQQLTKGLNPTSISEISGIPRATVIRKVNFLIKKNFIVINKKNNLFNLNNDRNSKSFKIQGKMFKKNQDELRIFIKEILNLIKN